MVLELVGKTILDVDNNWMNERFKARIMFPIRMHPIVVDACLV